MVDRTTFIISHRLSALANCDVLFVIEDGCLKAAYTDVTTAVRNLSVFDGADVPQGKT